MKVVINVCFGGFGLSRAAVARLAELQGRPVFFFSHARTADGGFALDSWEPFKEGRSALFFTAFDIPNPNEILRAPSNWHYLKQDEKIAYNALYNQHAFSDWRSNRTDPLLVRVVEELGERAHGQHAKLKIVEIPDGIEWEIDEYDGREQIAEQHRTWS